jgi:hypothetical protein
MLCAGKPIPLAMDPEKEVPSRMKTSEENSSAYEPVVNTEPVEPLANGVFSLEEKRKKVVSIPKVSTTFRKAVQA